MAGADRAMHAYVFIARGCWGFTHDEDGANLPAESGPWSFFRNGAIPDDCEERTTEDAAVAAELARQGFAMLPLYFLDKE